MMFELLLVVILAPVMFLALRKTDDTNLQIGVLPLAILLVLALPEESAMPASVGLALGAVGYLALFFGTRLRREPMPDYGSAGSSFPAPEVALSDNTRAPSGFMATPAGPDGPYYRPNSPAKRQLAEDGTNGEPMRFAGQVLGNDGRPVEGAIIEIWHADGAGEYDHTDFNCRGHQATNRDGQFVFDTVKPKGYGVRSMSLIGTVDFRSAHIHVKIRVGEPTFTTQVWFPDDDRNRLDVAYWAFKKTNVVEYEPSQPVLTARFDFVLDQPG
ncbi:MAG: hypothetical protein OXH37_06995 [Gammaproteobacteria bacterium]|nr:hypothetical protein [Gammaproteobacteria bacterium]